MSIEHVFTVRMVVTFIAVGVVAFVAFALIRSVVSRGMPVVWEILQITTALVCAALVSQPKSDGIATAVPNTANPYLLVRFPFKAALPEVVLKTITRLLAIRKMQNRFIWGRIFLKV